MTNSEGTWQSVTLPEALDEDALLNILLVCGQHLKLSRPVARANDKTIQVYCQDSAAYAEAKSLLDQAAADALLRLQIKSRSAPKIAELADAILTRAYQLR
ncbi:MAG: hypothetical protein AB2777_16625 [Candidatus Thiodiazotropha endolucinida]